MVTGNLQHIIKYFIVMMSVQYNLMRSLKMDLTRFMFPAENLSFFGVINTKQPVQIYCSLLTCNMIILQCMAYILQTL